MTVEFNPKKPNSNVIDTKFRVGDMDFIGNIGPNAKDQDILRKGITKSTDNEEVERSDNGRDILD